MRRKTRRRIMRKIFAKTLRRVKKLNRVRVRRGGFSL